MYTRQHEWDLVDSLNVLWEHFILLSYDLWNRNLWRLIFTLLLSPAIIIPKVEHPNFSSFWEHLSLCSRNPLLPFFLCVSYTSFLPPLLHSFSWWENQVGFGWERESPAITLRVNRVRWAHLEWAMTDIFFLTHSSREDGFRRGGSFCGLRMLGERHYEIDDGW